MTWSRLWLAFPVLACLGCGGGSNLTPVSGKVLVDGQPLAGASCNLRFIPVDGGAVGTASVDSSGAFTVMTAQHSGLKPGEYEVVVFATEAITGPPTDSKAPPPPPKSLIPERYGDPKQSGLKFKIDGSTKPLSIDITKK